MRPGRFIVLYKVLILIMSPPTLRWLAVFTVFKWQVLTIDFESAKLFEPRSVKKQKRNCWLEIRWAIIKQRRRPTRPRLSRNPIFLGAIGIAGYRAIGTSRSDTDSIIGSRYCWLNRSLESQCWPLLDASHSLDPPINSFSIREMQPITSHCRCLLNCIRLRTITALKFHVILVLRFHIGYTIEYGCDVDQ